MSLTRLVAGEKSQLLAVEMTLAKIAADQQRSEKLEQEE